eukprot:TRINITY_DN474_c1_g4_i1.p1 TRINITY_DN474_c1_g4~~TRINITY_DN474_c1_g4_i1.p1  ORF type:complete len:816 (+),score=338.17 TRINITY_DN474_c1_g4_i1:42-2489(+)
MSLVLSVPSVLNKFNSIESVVIENFEDFSYYLIEIYHEFTKTKYRINLEGLKGAILGFENYINSEIQRKEKFCFYKHLVKKMMNFAFFGGRQNALLLNFINSPTKKLSTIENIEQQQLLSFSNFEILFILCNAFFGTINTQNYFGDITFWYLFSDNTDVSKARIQCQLSYFYQSFLKLEQPLQQPLQQQLEQQQLEQQPLQQQPLEQQQSINENNCYYNYIINIKRLKLNNNCKVDWFNCNELIKENCVRVHYERMEHHENKGFFDFANKRLQIWEMIGSATQEEILFSCCPDAMIAMVVCDVIKKDEVIIIENVVRYSEYSGYANSFKFTGFYDRCVNKQFNILAADAVFKQHWQPQSILRDINKAYIGFSYFAQLNQSIATGHWGCGAFGGNKLSKFLQQICAASLAHATLDYSTFKENENSTFFNSIFNQLISKRVKISDLVLWISTFASQTQIRYFDDYIRYQVDHYLINSDCNNSNSNSNSNIDSSTNKLPRWKREGNFFNGKCGEYISKQLKENNGYFKPKFVNFTHLGYWLSHHGPNEPVSIEASYHGYYDQNINDLFTKWMDEFDWFNREIIKNNMLWIEIGANIGSEIVYAALQGADVIAIEPVIDNFHKICETIWINKWWDHVYPFNIALSNESKKSKICFLNNSGASIAGLNGCDRDVQIRHADEWFNEMEIFKEVEIEQSNNNLINSLGNKNPKKQNNNLKSNRKSWFVHIDIETSEYRFMSAASKFISDKRIKKAIVEVSNVPPNPFESVEQMIQQWIDLGYTISMLQDDLVIVDKFENTHYNISKLVSFVPCDFLLQRLHD